MREFQVSPEQSAEDTSEERLPTKDGWVVLHGLADRGAHGLVRQRLDRFDGLNRFRDRLGAAWWPWGQRASLHINALHFPAKAKPQTTPTTR